LSILTNYNKTKPFASQTRYTLFNCLAPMKLLWFSAHRSWAGLVFLILSCYRCKGCKKLTTDEMINAKSFVKLCSQTFILTSGSFRGL